MPVCWDQELFPGDEVIIPSFTFIATATSVSMSGAHPVVADVDIRTCCIDPDSVNEQITQKNTGSDRGSPLWPTL